ncbi:MAG: ribonuclease J [Clostridia bacterium]|nr:ribonuclease J [Clostridia bacterium]
MLGGIGEIGQNLAVIEYEDDIVVIDCGLGFPDDDMLGIDLVIPDTLYLEENADRVRGVFLTHGHEDHIGAIPYLLKNADIPIFGTRLTIGIIQNKLAEHELDFTPRLHTVEAGDTVHAGKMDVEFIRVNHSIADSCAIAVHTPQGVILHSGDFKLDLTPIDGDIMDIARLGELGKEGVLLLMCESTNAERTGYTPSEVTVGKSLDNIFLRYKKRRIVIATFSSNVYRVQQIIDNSIAYGRKVALTGRSMLNIVEAANNLGYMKIPAGTLIDISEIKRFKPSEVTVITTGSQGEPMSALYRMAYSEHAQIELGPDDLVVLSANAIPGNEKKINNIVNEFMKRGVEVFRDQALGVHVSGHACAEELKLMHALTKPKFFMPIHGEYKHLVAHSDLARSMGRNPNTIFIGEVGRVLEVTSKKAVWGGTIPSGKLLVDGYGVGDVGNIVLRDRRHLGEDGIIIVTAAISMDAGIILNGPEIVSRGFVYVRENEELIEKLRDLAYDAIEKALDHHVYEWGQIKKMVSDALGKYIYQLTKRRPMIVPIILDA